MAEKGSGQPALTAVDPAIGARGLDDQLAFAESPEHLGDVVGAHVEHPGQVAAADRLVAAA